MLGGLVEVAQEGQVLSLERGFLVAKAKGDTKRLPLDQMEALILSARSATLSRSLMAELAARGIAVIVSGENYEPEAMLVPVRSKPHVIGHPADQAAMTEPQRKRLWRSIVEQKIINQAKVLKSQDVEPAATRLLSLKNRVKPGDADNAEAVAARTYFPALFGKGFVRERQSPGINAALNYGYAIIRAHCARSLVGVGLVPALGIHHRSRRNPLCLADDLMEVFRPAVDLLVVSEVLDRGASPDALDRATKQSIARVLTLLMEQEGSAMPVTKAIDRSALSLAQCLAGQTKNLSLPALNAAPPQYAS